jgi:peptide-methionine (R)-S-oxide reductase
MVREVALVAMLNRRTFLGGVGAIGAVMGMRWLNDAGETPAARVEFEKTDSEWRRLLTKAQYDVLRLHRTEIPGSSPLNHEIRAGTFECAACALPLFSSEAKYDSRTGWPSFFRPLENAIGMSTDYVFLMPRTEVHCRRCGGHLGHRFEDGPPPTGLRYCINGVALTFRTDAGSTGSCHSIRSTLP